MRKFLLLTLIILNLYSNDMMVQTDEFVLGEIYTQKVSKNSYFNALGLPNVSVGVRCPKKGDCWNVIQDQNARVLRSFSPSESVGTLAKGRYEKVAYLYYSYTYGSKKNRHTKYYLVDQNHKQYTLPNMTQVQPIFAKIISKQRDIIEVGSRGVYKNGSQILSNELIETASIANNPQGDIAIAAVLDLSNEVLVTNLSQWKSSTIILPQHSDRKGILSVYPQDKDNIYMTVYKNINIYNKGLMGAHVDFKNDVSEKGWLINSAKRNIGFSPSMYIDKNVLHVGTTDSTNRKAVHLVVTPQHYANLGKQTPKHIEGFEEESFIDLLVGVGISQTDWLASSEIGDISSASNLVYGEVAYDIGKTLYKSLYFEGRVGSTHLSVAYLQNEAEKIGGLAGDVSEILNFLVDFDGFINDSTTLRLKVLKGNINGIATFIDNTNGSTALTSNATTKEFKSELITYSALFMGERGIYYGLEYSNYISPSAVGFSDASKQVLYYGMDNNFKINTYSLVFGYDEISYAKRYEVDLSRWYMQALGGIGWADYSLSSETQDYVENQTGKSINYTGSFTFNGELELGYIFQQRFKAARGLGYSFTAGYRLRGAYNSTGQTENTGENDVVIGENELELEMSRYDLWYGPFASANFIF